MESMGIMDQVVDASFWKNKKVFLTGHTGFKGSWTSLWLLEMGALVKGFALAPNTEPALFNIARVDETMESEIGNICELEKLSESMAAFNPDIVIHMAAQPLVRKSYQDPVETYATNVMGTVNVLEAARKCKNLKAIVSVTTDKCYENREWEWGYRENEPMGGHDPYSSSKGCAELVTAAYRASFFHTENAPAVATARAGNVIGGGDWAQDRLVPDILSAFAKAKPVIIRNPLSTRPWQHVLEPVSGYLILAQKLFNEGHSYAEAWNFGPLDQDCKPVSYVLDKLVEHWSGNASWELDKNSNPHEAGFLKLDCSKAALRLDWHPKWNLDETTYKIVDWYQNWLSGSDMKLQCIQEINNYNNNTK